MNKRIAAIASYIDEYDKVADIGCDKALLGEALAINNIPSIASDIKAHIVDEAYERIKKLNLDKFVKFIVSDGLKNLESEEIDALVIAGMGTYTILNILTFENRRYKKIITISNNHHDILRKNMLDLGYKIKEEQIIFEKKKFYNLIVFIPGQEKYSQEELLIGKNHKNKLALIQKLEIELEKHKKNYKQSKNNEILKKIKIIEKMLTYH